MPIRHNLNETFIRGVLYQVLEATKSEAQFLEDATQVGFQLGTVEVEARSLKRAELALVLETVDQKASIADPSVLICLASVL